MPTNSFIQVPPDSTGKRLFAQQHSVDEQFVLAQVMHIADPDFPERTQHVDTRGQASVRFAEGSPTLDAFGNLRVAIAKSIGGYEYTNGDMADLFTDAVTPGEGVIAHYPVSSTTKVAVSGVSGASAVRTSNRYHYYQPGIGHLVVLTLYHGDSGKENNIRRWGYGDTEDGLFWELSGTVLGVGIRSSVSGSVVDVVKPRAEWNGDKLDGLGLSGMTIDLTKRNYFWVDFGWYGTAPVRFGVVSPDGSRWVCHTFQNPNAGVGPFMKTGSLPIRFENFNTGITSGTSEMHLICAAVYAESQTDYTFWRFADIGRDTPIAVTTDTPVLSMRPVAGTRVGIYPESLSVFVVGGAVKLTIIDNAVLTGATWGQTGGGVAQGDLGATAATGGGKFKTFYVGAGVTNIDLSDIYETNDEGYHRLADDSDGYTFTLLATKLDGTTVTVGATLGYKELR